MQPNALCDRCRKLEGVIHEFEKPVQVVARKPEGADRSHQEIIPRASIVTTCRLCIQFSSLFQACAKQGSQSDLLENHDHVLKCRFWWHPDFARLVAYHRISYHGKPSFVFLHLNGSLPLSIVDTDQPDYKRLRHWTRSCKDNHEYCKLHERTSVPRVTLKAINCLTRTICILPPSTDYVCLSYVWGSSKHAQRQEIADTGRPLYDLPKTIEDAMYVTLQLGINFLWVDRYCIDQQDDREKHHMISHMDQVYLNSTITIIAAEGDGPHAGLPGVCGTPRKPQRLVRLQQLTLIGIENVSQYVQNSKWNTRGWTYQEMLLSRRILLFTNTRIYFQCLSGFGLEGVTRTILRRRQEWNTNDMNWTEKVPGTKPVFPILQSNLIGKIILSRLSEYFERSLSFQADTVRAVLGIFNVLSVTSTFRLRQFYGMPVVLYTGHLRSVTEDFVERLTWVAGTNNPCHKPGPRLSDGYGLPNTDLSAFTPGAELYERTGLFPSWSWAAFRADCPGSEQAKGLKLIFPGSHKHVNTERSFDGTDTDVRIFRRDGAEAKSGGPKLWWSSMALGCRPSRLSNFMNLREDSANSARVSVTGCESYDPRIDVTAWTWHNRVSDETLKTALDAYNIAVHFDDCRTLEHNFKTGMHLTIVHIVTYKIKYLHEEEMYRIVGEGSENKKKLTRAPSNPHERSYHVRMLLVKRCDFQTYARVGVLTVDTMWRGDKPPGSVEDILKSMLKPRKVGVRNYWERKTLRLV